MLTDYRDAKRREHSVLSLVSQRVIGLALGYEDLNDHDHLARDQMLAIAGGKTDPTGMGQKDEQDRGKPLAGKSTLNRLELTGEDAAAQIPCNKKGRLSKYQRAGLSNKGAKIRASIKGL